MIFASLLIPFTLIGAAPSVDITDRQALIDASLKASSRLFEYYQPNPFGTVEDAGPGNPDGVQWYENGIYWEVLMRITKDTSDSRFMTTCGGALYNASFGSAANFFGPNGDQQHSYLVMNNQWNDDILWFGMPALSGAELYDVKAPMPGGSLYLTLAKNTYDDVWTSWDPTTCKGGIFWIAKRIKSSGTADVNYKSTITNAQFLSFSARLYLLTNDATYLTKAAQVYTWLHDIGLITTSGNVYDGASAPTCTSFNTDRIALSYIYGQLIEGLSYLYQATGKDSYLKDAELYATRALAHYSLNNVVRDTCEPRCDTKTVPPKGILLRGYAALYPLTSPAIQTQIKTQIQASFEGMLKTCDSTFNCNSNWGSDGTIQTDFHKQINVVELFHAALTVFAPREKPTKFGYSISTATTLGTSSSSGASLLSSDRFAMSSFFVGFLLSFLLG